MMDDNDIELRRKLIGEIKHLTQVGWKKQDIIKSLSAQGISPALVNELISQVYSYSNMVKPAYNKEASQNSLNHGQTTQTRSYINNQTNLSNQENNMRSSINNPKDSLMNSNNPSYPVSSSTGTNTTMKIQHTHSLSAVTIFFLAFFVLALVGSSFFLFNYQSSNGNDYLLDYQIQLVKTDFNSGEMIEFNTVYANMGKKNQYDVFVNYKIKNSSDNTLIEWEETKAVSNVQRNHVSKLIPEDIPSGKYYIYSEVTYGDNQKATSRTMFFDIRGENSKQKNEENTDNKSSKDDNIDEINDNINESEEANKNINPINDTTDNVSIKNDTNNNTSITTERNESTNNTNSTIVGNSSEEHLDDEEAGDNQTLKDLENDSEMDLEDYKKNQQKVISTIEEAKSYSINDPQHAAELCLNLSEDNFIDKCFQDIAKASENYRFCDEVKSSASRDFCYVNYVIKTNDYDKCDMISAEKTKRSCYYLNPNYKPENDS